MGFARVSTAEHDLSLQLEALEASECEMVFHGKHSGVSTKNEAKLNELINISGSKNL